VYEMRTIRPSNFRMADNSGAILPGVRIGTQLQPLLRRAVCPALPCANLC